MRTGQSPAQGGAGRERARRPQAVRAHTACRCAEASQFGGKPIRPGLQRGARAMPGRARHAEYRAANRYIVFQVLPHTLGLGPEVWRVLARAHDVRNRGEYEGDLYVDERLLADLVVACKAVAAALNRLPPL